jgi:2-dehydropantoate 2-reductase
MNTEQPKRILVLGAGAIGGYVGGCLASAGHLLTMLCTPETGDLVRAEGLYVQTEEGGFHLHPSVATTAAEAFSAGDADLAIVAVKRYDTAAAAGPLRPFAARVGHVLCLQNGLGAEEELAGLLGADCLIPGTVTTAVRRAGRNRVLVERKRGVGIAAGGSDGRWWAAELDRAGLNCLYYEEARAMKWSKVLTNLIANPASAILDLPPATIYAHPGLFRLEILQLREALTVMDALRIRVVDLPGIPVRLLAFCARRLPLSVARLVLARALGRGRGGKMPSFHADLHEGRGKSEIDYYHGAVVREAEALGIPAPVNRLLTETFTGIMNGRLAHAEFRRRPERLLAGLTATR